MVAKVAIQPSTVHIFPLSSHYLWLTSLKRFSMELYTCRTKLISTSVEQVYTRRREE